MAGTIHIHHLVCHVYSASVLLVLSHTAWRHRHVRVNNLPKVGPTLSVSNTGRNLVNATSSEGIAKKLNDLFVLLFAQHLVLFSEIHKYGDFYRFSDVRPPFTYAALIRQVR